MNTNSNILSFEELKRKFDDFKEDSTYYYSIISSYIHANDLKIDVKDIIQFYSDRNYKAISLVMNAINKANNPMSSAANHSNLKASNFGELIPYINDFIKDHAIINDDTDLFEDYSTKAIYISIKFLFLYHSTNIYNNMDFDFLKQCIKTNPKIVDDYIECFAFRIVAYSEGYNVSKIPGDFIMECLTGTDYIFDFICYLFNHPDIQDKLKDFFINDLNGKRKYISRNTLEMCKWEVIEHVIDYMIENNLIDEDTESFLEEIVYADYIDPIKIYQWEKSDIEILRYIAVGYACMNSGFDDIVYGYINSGDYEKEISIYNWVSKDFFELHPLPKDKLMEILRDENYSYYSYAAWVYLFKHGLITVQEAEEIIKSNTKLYFNSMFIEYYFRLFDNNIDILNIDENIFKRISYRCGFPTIIRNVDMLTALPKEYLKCYSTYVTPASEYRYMNTSKSVYVKTIGKGVLRCTIPDDGIVMVNKRYDVMFTNKLKVEEVVKLGSNKGLTILEYYDEDKHACSINAKPGDIITTHPNYMIKFYNSSTIVFHIFDGIPCYKTN